MLKALLISLVLAAVPPAAASPVVDTPSPVADSLLRNPTFAVLVVTVTEATVESGTNGSPPHGTLRVDEVLRGSEVSPGEHRYRMATPWVEAEAKLRPGWRSAPLPGPATGDRLIVFSYDSTPVAPDNVVTLLVPLLRDTPEWRGHLEARLETDSKLLLPLFLLVLLLPLVALASLVVSRMSTSGSGTRRSLRRLQLILPPLALPFYLLYEWLLSPVYDIRVDLFVLWPMLALGAVVWLVAASRKERDQG